jgi:hypothetical protein
MGHITPYRHYKPYESAKNFKYLGLILTHEYSVYEEINNRLKPGRPATIRSSILYSTSAFDLEKQKLKYTEL